MTISLGRCWMRHGLDTCFLVAFEAADHPKHADSRALVDQCRSNGDDFALAPQVLAEFVHVLTDHNRFCPALQMVAALERAGATGLSSSRIHQLLNAPEAKEIPVWVSQLRQSSRGSGGKKKAERPESETKIRSRLAREVEVLRECIDWLQRLERGESVVVNLRPDADAET